MRFRLSLAWAVWRLKLERVPDTVTSTISSKTQLFLATVPSPHATRRSVGFCLYPRACCRRLCAVTWKRTLESCLASPRLRTKRVEIKVA